MPRSCLFRKRDQRAASLSVKLFRNRRALSLRCALYFNMGQPLFKSPLPPFFKGGLKLAHMPPWGRRRGGGLNTLGSRAKAPSPAPSPSARERDEKSKLPRRKRRGFLELQSFLRFVRLRRGGGRLNKLIREPVDRMGGAPGFHASQHSKNPVPRPVCSPIRRPVRGPAFRPAASGGVSSGRFS